MSTVRALALCAVLCAGCSSAARSPRSAAAPASAGVSAEDVRATLDFAEHLRPIAPDGELGDDARAWSRAHVAWSVPAALDLARAAHQIAAMETTEALRDSLLRRGLTSLREIPRTDDGIRGVARSVARRIGPNPCRVEPPTAAETRVARALLADIAAPPGAAPDVVRGFDEVRAAAARVRALRVLVCAGELRLTVGTLDEDGASRVAPVIEP